MRTLPEKLVEEIRAIFPGGGHLPSWSKRQSLGFKSVYALFWQQVGGEIPLGFSSKEIAMSRRKSKGSDDCDEPSRWVTGEVFEFSWVWSWRRESDVYKVFLRFFVQHANVKSPGSPFEKIGSDQYPPSELLDSFLMCFHLMWLHLQTDPKGCQPLSHPELRTHSTVSLFLRMAYVKSWFFSYNFSLTSKQNWCNRMRTGTLSFYCNKEKYKYLKQEESNWKTSKRNHSRVLKWTLKDRCVSPPLQMKLKQKLVILFKGGRVD